MRYLNLFLFLYILFIYFVYPAFRDLKCEFFLAHRCFLKKEHRFKPNSLEGFKTALYRLKL